MKNIIICLSFTLFFLMNEIHAQNMAINTDGSVPDASAMLDIASTTKGFLPPRMTTAQQNSIPSPAKGLLIYNTTNNVFMVNTGTSAFPVWTALSSSSNNWLLTGNSGSNSSTNFLGTTDNMNLVFRTNNSQRMVIDASGYVGIGVTNPANPLVVKDTFEVRRTGSAVSQLLFSNTAGTGDFRIAGDGGDIFWQGGGSRNLQMGAYWGVTLAGDRQTSTLPAFAAGVANTGVLIQAQRDVSVPLAIQSNSASQSANLTEWRNSSGTILNMVNKNGNVAIGASIFNATNPEKLLVDAGATTSVNAIVGKGNINSYLQLNIQNNSSGANASSDVVATANNGDETTNYVDMGINGGSNTSNVMGTANDAYLYNIGQNFMVGTGTTGKALMFLTGGTDSASNERMRIDGSGNVGIGIANPGYRLQVNATANPLKLIGLQTGSSADSILTVSNGVVRRLNASALVISSSNAWGLTGNSSTNPTTNFIGTTDAQALVVKANNTQVARFDANSMALGISATTVNSTHSYAFGSGATIGYNKTAAMALGNNAAINNDSSFAMGTAAVTNGANSFAIGNSATSNSSNSFAMGRNAVTAYSITDAIAIGTNATANSSNSIAIGSNTTSASKTTTNAASAIAMGNGAVSNSTNGITIGTGSTTGYNLTNPVAIGVGTLINGSNGTAIGNGASISYVSNATVLGAGATASGTATNSTAIGYNTDVTKANEIILGDMTNTALSVGIGSEGFSTLNKEKLLVDAGVTSSVNTIVAKGNINSYLQLNIQNNSSGTNASSDLVATANNGDETTNYVDMGINGGSYSGGVMGAANDGYLYTMGNNFLIGTGNASKSVVFMTGGTSQAANERMRIDGSGNVGIGVTNPVYKLQVNAASNPLQLIGLQTGSSADSILTVSNGVVRRLKAADLITSSSSAWNIAGNTVTPGSQFLGSTNNTSLRFRTNNTERMVIDSTGKVGIGTNNPASDFTISQSSGLSTTKGMRFTGNSIGGTSSGTGFAMALGYNTPNNKQLWLGDVDYLGNNAATFFRMVASNGYCSIDAVSGDNSSRRSVAFGVGGDPASAVILGADNNNVAPSSYVWANGNMAIGNGFRSIAAPVNGLLVQGSIGIGTSVFNAINPEKFIVDAGNTTSVNAFVGRGSINSYLQLNIQNTSSGTSASSDVVATANNGDESSNYVDMGINGGNYAGGFMGSANDGYLYTMGNNFLLGTGNASKSLIFMTGGTSQSSNERMRIDGSGNVGIGTNNPTSTLTVTGSQSVSYRSGTGAYTILNTDYVIINTGGSTPTWTLPAASTCAGRVYRLINHGTSSVTLTPAITIANAATSASLSNLTGTNTYEIISDGLVWRKMD